MNGHHQAEAPSGPTCGVKATQFQDAPLKLCFATFIIAMLTSKKGHPYYPHVHEFEVYGLHCQMRQSRDDFSKATEKSPSSQALACILELTPRPQSTAPR
ncbi:hypothetical protein NX059_009355 [Plenodomus lindquistii]|nr:hypothetical protein NX059_009355 [Plenodomus lindquistii]